MLEVVETTVDDGELDDEEDTELLVDDTTGAEEDKLDGATLDEGDVDDPLLDVEDRLLLLEEEAPLHVP